VSDFGRLRSYDRLKLRIEGAPCRAKNFNVVCVCVCVCVYIYIYIYIYIYMDLRLATLKAVTLYLLHNVSTLDQCRKFFRDTVVCKHFVSYRGYPNYRWDLIRYAKGCVLITMNETYFQFGLCTFVVITP
jgi:hypothetical protein